jgi:Mg2+ and Co2+ transporter CorA
MTMTSESTEIPTPPPPSGRPVSGVIWLYRFDAAGKASARPIDEPFELFDPNDGFLWLHLDLVDRLARVWIEKTVGLPPAARAVLLGTDELPMLECDDTAVWGVFIDTIQDPEDDELRAAPMRFVLGDGYLVSGRRHPVRSAALMRSRVEAGHPVSGPVALFELMIVQVLRAIGEMLRELRDTADSIEDRVLDDRFHDEARRLAPLRRTTVRIRRQLGSFRGVLKQFVEDQSGRSIQIGSREAAERLFQRIEALDQELLELQDRARFLQDEIAAKLANTTNRHLYVLSILTAMLMPATLVTGIFGMNTSDLPLEGGGHGTFVAIGIAIAASALVLYLLRRLGFFE